MCLYVKEKSKVKTLKRARLGWKRVKRDGDDDFWRSPIQDHNYALYGKTVTARKKMLEWDGYICLLPIKKEIEDIVIEESFNHGHQKAEYVVREGYHSYRILLGVLLGDMLYGEHECLRPCVIPKGTRYVNGYGFERASKEIIVCRTLKDALKILHEQNRRNGRILCWNKMTENEKNDFMYNLSHQDR